MIRKLLFIMALSLGLVKFSTAQTTAPAIEVVYSFDSCTAISNNTINIFAIFLNVNNTMTANVYWGDGSTTNHPVTIQQTTYGQLNTSHLYTTPGTYTIMVELLDAANTPLDSFTLVKTSFCQSFGGLLYKRGDANCTFDSPIDVNLNAPVDIELRENNVPIDTINGYNSFFYTIPNASYTAEYSLHPLSNNMNLVLACPSASIGHKFRLDTLNVNNNRFNFGFDCGTAPGFDLFTYGSGLFRPVSNSYINVSAGNLSCLPQTGTLTLNLTPKYTFVSSTSVPPTSVAGQTITWSLANLHAANSKYFAVTLSPVGVPTVGDTVVNVLTITPNTGDINLANNIATFIDTIRASFDPNEKEVIPAGDITAGELLTYTIHFENLGNDTAFNIHVIDTLSANLDINTFKLLYSSHGVNTNVFEVGGHHVARFDFANINLADSSQPEHNKGFFIYEIKAKSSMNPGDEVRNTAHIYFDINPAIVTNTTVSKIPSGVGIDTRFAANGLKVYPNPAKGFVILDVENQTTNVATLSNVLGQTMRTQKLQKGINKIDISELSAGVYYITVYNPNGSSTAKLIVK